MARQRGLVARAARIHFTFPARFTFDHLTLTDPARADTVLRVDSLGVALDPGALLLLRVRIAAAGVSHATLHLPGGGGTETDTLMPPPRRRDAPARAARVRRAAESVVQVLAAPARRLPRMSMADVTFISRRPGGEAETVARLTWFDARPTPRGVRIAAAGVLEGEMPLPFDASVTYALDDRLIGGARLRVPDNGMHGARDLRLTVDGAVTQDRRAGVVSVSDTTHLRIGDLPLRLGARLDRHGPRVRFTLAGEGFNEAQVKGSLPPAFLGPLLDVGVRGRWDYRLGFDLDFERPDSVQFTADVVPHGLALDPARTRLRLLGLDEPFTAAIHLPGGEVSRDLSASNPHFRPLTGIAPALIYAVVTNEDGGFFRHRGFNTGAVREAIAENIRAGAFRRGAGTITMQLARNLYLGHDRTLARKFREVVLAWILEHLTGTSKERLLEIYLNIIEWGPDVHGAAEAARFYFDRDPAALRIDEALFLATIVPAPRKWRYRFDREGRLRPFVREQMHFIGRAMIAKGWLTPEELPGPDSLLVELRGQAREIAVPDSLRGRLDWLFGDAAPRSGAPSPHASLHLQERQGRPGSGLPGYQVDTGNTDPGMRD